jgi:hypothetical protein
MLSDLARCPGDKDQHALLLLIGNIRALRASTNICNTICIRAHIRLYL